METIGDLNAEIGFSELRNQDLVSERLSRHHAIRVRRRGELIGVLLDAEKWESMLEQIERLRRENERYEDEAVLMLLRERARGEFVPATDAAIDDVLGAFESLAGLGREAE